MRLTAWEEERLLIFTAAELARRHRATGLRLNHPEAVALICDAMLEAARAGGRYREVVEAGRSAVRADELLEGIRDLLDEVRLEVLLDEGTRLIVLIDPLGDRDPLVYREPEAADPAATRAEGDPSSSDGRQARSDPVKGPDPTGGGRT